MKSETQACDYSVAIPAYGRPDELRATLQAVFAQRWPSGLRWEVLVSDNCSDPPLQDALGEFAGKIRLGRNERNLGYVGNWNRTLQLARGRWVHMLHSDDLVSPDFVSVMWRLITERSEKPVLVHSWLKNLLVNRTLISRWYSSLAGNSDPEDDPGAPVEYYRKGDEAVRHTLFQGVRAPTVIVRKDAACSIDGYLDQHSISSDEEYFPRLAQVGDVLFTPRRLITYRYHANQLSVELWLRPDFIEAYGKLHEHTLSFLGGQVTSEDRAAMNRRVADLAVGVAFQQAVHGHLDLSRRTLEDAVRRDPAILSTSGYRRTRLIIRRGVVRWLYRSFFL